MKQDFHLLILTKYARSGPSSRYRILQFIPFLESLGFRCDVQSLHTEDYLASLYAGRPKGACYRAGRLFSRARAVSRARRYSVVFVQKELAPYLPPVLERMLSGVHAKVVHDIDDAICLAYERSANPLVRLALRGKIPEALRRASVVLAGNTFLAEYALRHNPRTLYFPTVIDPAKYAGARVRAGGAGSGMGPVSGSGGGVSVVGWIGSPGTVGFLSEKAEVLSAVARVSPFELRVIGAEAPVIPGVRSTGVPWSEETEARELARCDVGVMPLPRDDWSRGKCGLKLLQYMASGLPVVSSPAGGADRIVRHGTNGYIASSDAEWRLHLAALLDNAALRGVMGREGLRHVEERFSLAVWAPRMGEVLMKCARGEPLEDLSW